MDTPGRASNSITLTTSAVLIFLFFICICICICTVPAGAQTGSSPIQPVDQAKQLYEAQRWQEIVSLAESAQNSSADLDFYYGTALAQLGRLEDAQRVFIDGARLQPQDKRFSLELGGVAFKLRRYPQAVHHLRRALRLDPRDTYGNDFLGTVYFLHGNIEAALKYWNRVNKPQIADVRAVPTPRVNAALLDRAFTFAPASSLQLPDLLTSDVRIGELGIFPSYQFDLQARDDGRFDILLRNRERDGWGQSELEKLFLLFRGLPFLSITPEFYNLRREAINFVSTYRWDAEKRRLYVEVSSPFKGNPKLRYGLVADLRSENWDIRNSFQGPAPLLGSLNMRREGVGANFPLSRVAAGAGRGAELSHRDFAV